MTQKEKTKIDDVVGMKISHGNSTPKKISLQLKISFLF